MYVVDSSNIVLNPSQAAFLRSRERYVGMFGGYANGKTWAACLRIIELATQNPRNLIMVGRRIANELNTSVIDVFMTLVEELYPPEAYSWNKTSKRLTFWNRSEVFFVAFEDRRKGSLKGPNLGAFYVDQAEEIDEEVFEILQSRLRRNGCNVLQGIVTGNPVGHNWTYYKFGIDKAPPQMPSHNEYCDWKHGTNYRMFTVSTYENAHNLGNKTYIQELRESYSDEWFKRYVLGSWDEIGDKTLSTEDIRGYDQLPQIIQVFTACDPAISKADDACNTAFCTVGVGKDGYVYDLETIAGKWSFNEQLEQACGIMSRLSPAYIGVEDVNYQRVLAEALRVITDNIHIVDLKADKDKFRRAKGVSHLMNRFRTNNMELLAEIASFHPDAKGKAKKDRVDALVHALTMVQRYGFLGKLLDNPTEERKSLTPQERHLKEYFKSLNLQSKGEEVEVIDQDYEHDHDSEYF
jgi:phage terminase large subunit-like protein